MLHLVALVNVMTCFRYVLLPVMCNIFYNLYFIGQSYGLAWNWGCPGFCTLFAGQCIVLLYLFPVVRHMNVNTSS